MRQETRGTLTLCLVASIAVVMLLAFGVRSIDTAAECQVSPVQCKYSELIVSAKANHVIP